MINGIINVYKEKGFTSFDVVAKMRGMFHQKKIGHTGTLDPDAEGVLPVCLGKATKVCDLLTDKEKEYRAVLLLGQETDTQDISGKVINTRPVNVSEQEVTDTILSFIGEYDQIPPMYSALKVDGKKLCDLARKGITVERKARKVHIYSIKIINVNLPEVEFSVYCSKGTYIRTLCDDIGKKLGCFGCMKSLLRTRVDRFYLEQAYTLEQIQQIIDKRPESEWEFIEPVDSVFYHYPIVQTKEEAQKLVLNGNRIPETMTKNRETTGPFSTPVRMYDYKNKFVGIYRFMEENKEYKPVKIFLD